MLLLGGCRRGEQDPDASGAGSGPSVADFLKEHKLLGKPVLIEFGMVGCEMSAEGFSMMITLHSNDIIEGLQYVRVESSDKADEVAQYYKDNAADFPVIQDPEGQVADVFGATIIPVFMLIDKFGNTRYMGGFPGEDLGDWSGMLLAETEDPGPDIPRLGVKEIDGKELLASTKLPELGGAEQTLAEYMGPGGMMLVFADANCPYSDIAITELPKVSLTLGKAARVSTVVVNITDPEEKVRGYYGKKNLDVPVVYDTGSSVRMSWDVQSVPTIVFFDPQQNIIYSGPAVWADVGSAGETALGLRPGSLRFTSRGTRFG